VELYVSTDKIFFISHGRYASRQLAKGDFNPATSFPKLQNLALLRLEIPATWLQTTTEHPITSQIPSAYFSNYEIPIAFCADKKRLFYPRNSDRIGLDVRLDDSLVLHLRTTHPQIYRSSNEMRLDLKLLSLPASILLLVASYSELVSAADSEKAAARWPFNLLSNLKYWPGESANRDAGALSGDCGNGIRPVGVMKMSDDEGEKFYMEYWQFAGDMQQQSPMLSMASSSSLRTRDAKEEARLLANASMPISYRPPFALHTESDISKQDLRARGAAALAVLENRDFTCPTGTLSCSNIGYPNSCCATSETCFQIQDTGLGPVGCCPSESNCGGTITNCDSPNTACPDNLGGGCCIPNYVCAGVGCKFLQ
jgi:hypothetical protein